MAKASGPTGFLEVCGGGGGLGFHKVELWPCSFPYSTLPQETMAISRMTLSKPLSSLESIGSHWLNWQWWLLLPFTEPGPVMNTL